MIQTACPLDCYDACAVTCDSLKPNRLIATPSHPIGNGALCRFLNYSIHNTDRITKPTIDGKEVSMKEALDSVAKILHYSKPLLWRGSGNLGVMQSVTNLLIEKCGGSLTYGSLCDGAGQAGIEAGRGVNRLLSPQQIEKADVVVVWGRNITVTNSHLMPFIKGKKLIVIDPVATPIAKMAHLHIQIKPRTDFYLAILLSRFTIMEDAQNDEWIEEFGGDIEDFYDFTRSFRIKILLEYMGLNLDDMGDMLHYLQSGKVVFLVGAGVQKYSIGHYALWAIDSLAATLGLFGKEGCGVSYLGVSRGGFEDPFDIKCKRESIVNTPFSKYQSVIIQGGNPAESMPNSLEVIKSLKEVENLIYFGLYENETSKLAKIVIPAKNFLEKEDIRLSYGHQYVTYMPKVIESDYGISEYQFTAEIFQRLGYEGLESESYYINRWLSQCKEVDEHKILPDYQEIPYQSGFGEDGEDEFEFIDDFDDEFEDTKAFRKFKRKHKDDGLFWLLTPKYHKSLNTQFERADFVVLHPNMGFKDGDILKIVSEYGEVVLKAKNSSDIRDDCVLIYAGTKGVNNVTPPIESEEGGGACFQETKVSIERL